MSPENFVYWLNGFIELDGSLPTEQQWYSIKDHLKLVIDKKTTVRNVEAESPFKLTPINPSDIKITC